MASTLSAAGKDGGPSHNQVATINVPRKLKLCHQGRIISVDRDAVKLILQTNIG